MKVHCRSFSGPTSRALVLLPKLQVTPDRHHSSQPGFPPARQSLQGPYARIYCLPFLTTPTGFPVRFRYA